MISIEDQTLFWKSWYSKGIRLIKDLFCNDGTFITTEKIKQDHNINCSFLKLLQLRMAIPLDWRGKMKNTPNVEDLQTGIFFDNGKTFCCIKDTNSKKIYWELLLRSNILRKPKAMDKWKSINLGNFDNLEWRQIFETPVKSCRSIKLQSFQYRIVHRIITCNHWLFNVKLKDSPNCNCGEDDTMEHFFFNCNDSNIFWNSLSEWSKCNIDFNITDIMFGLEDSDIKMKVFNFMIIFAKRYIHDQKLMEKKILLTDFLSLLKHEIELERLIYMKSDKLDIFDFKWNFVFLKLKNINENSAV